MNEKKKENLSKTYIKFQKRFSFVNFTYLLDFWFYQTVGISFSLVNHIHLVGFRITEYEEAVT